MKILILLIAIFGINTLSFTQEQEPNLNLTSLYHHQENFVEVLNVPKGSECVISAKNISLVKSGEKWLAIPSRSAKSGTITVYIYYDKKVTFSKIFELPFVD